MRKAKRLAAMILAAWVFVTTAQAFGQRDDSNRQSNPNDSAAPRAATPAKGMDDGVEFIKRFKLGMSYNEVQAALPKNVEQDTLIYVTTDEAFLLNVELPEAGGWSASFRFDTQDAPTRRPERLIEMSCTASLSSRRESFEALVDKVTAAFGEPVKVDRTGERIQQAGWRVGGSLLTLEYSFLPNGIGNNVTIEFTIRRGSRRAATADNIA
ncbi:MAG TPA: hypothetical protein VKA60_23335 [Blastocatellia bacterium]|nr:hypothetical protein [Blastocatellia bacterium]